MKAALALALAAALAVRAQVDPTLEQLISSREAQVQTLRDRAVTLFRRRCEAAQRRCDACSFDMCTTNLPSDGECVSDFGTPTVCESTGQMISRTTSGVKVAEGALLTSAASVHEDVCYSREMEATFVSNVAASASVAWQYYGTDNGVFRMFPGSAWGVEAGQCSPFDPRSRPWYIAATSGPKNVVFVLDTSGSMNDLGRMELLRDAVKTVLAGLTNADWVALVRFSDTASSFSTRLVPATSANKALMNAWVDNLVATGNTFFDRGMQLAFNVLRDSRSLELGSSCLTTMLFLTDGVPTDQEASLTTLRQNLDNDTIIFTYSLGSAAEERIPKMMACEGRGIWSRIEDNGDLRGQMSQYYRFIAAGVQRTTVAWTEPYEDANGLGQVVTAALPVYDDTLSPPYLLGVVGVDIILRDFGSSASSQSLVASLARRSSVCFNFQPTACQLQYLRRKRTALGFNDAAVCPDPQPALSSCPAGDSETRPTCLDPIASAAVPICPGSALTESNYAESVCCDDSGLGVGAIVGIVIGGVVLVAVVVVAVYFISMNRAKRQNIQTGGGSGSGAAGDDSPPARQANPRTRVPAPAPAPAPAPVPAPYNPSAGNVGVGYPPALPYTGATPVYPPPAPAPQTGWYGASGAPTGAVPPPPMPGAAGFPGAYPGTGAAMHPGSYPTGGRSV